MFDEMLDALNDSLAVTGGSSLFLYLSSHKPLVVPLNLLMKVSSLFSNVAKTVLCRGVATIFGVSHTPARVCQKPSLFVFFCHLERTTAQHLQMSDYCLWCDRPVYYTPIDLESSCIDFLCSESFAFSSPIVIT